jgi:hypothetical protein
VETVDGILAFELGGNVGRIDGAGRRRSRPPLNDDDLESPAPTKPADDLSRTEGRIHRLVPEACDRQCEPCSHLGPIVKSVQAIVADE